MPPEQFPWAAIVTTAGTLLVGLLPLVFGYFTSPPRLRRLGQIADVLDKTPADSEAARELGFMRDQIAREFREDFVIPNNWRRPGWFLVVAGTVSAAVSWFLVLPVPFIIGVVYLLLGAVLLALHRGQRPQYTDRGNAYVDSEVLRRLPAARAQRAREAAETAEAIADARALVRRSRWARRLRLGAIATAGAAIPALVVALVSARFGRARRR